MIRFSHTIATVMCLLPLAGVALSNQLESKPNIILILSDDHARQALSCYGNKDIQTPALDRLAKEGMRFNHALTPNSFCTPARAAVLTGKYSHKNGVTKLNQLFDGSQQTFPKLLQKGFMGELGNGQHCDHRTAMGQRIKPAASHRGKTVELFRRYAERQKRFGHCCHENLQSA